MENNQQNQRQSLIGIQELFKRSFELYKNNFWTFIVISLLPIAASMILPVLSLLTGFGLPILNLLRNPSSPIEFIGVLTSSLLASVPIFLLVGLIIIGVNVWGAIALIYAIKNNEAGVKESFLQTKDRVLSAIWVGLLVGIALFFGYLLFFIPGIIFSIWFSFSFYVLIYEGLHGTKALSRSKQLVDGHWWDVFARLAIIGVVFFFLNLIIQGAPLLSPILGLLSSSFGPVYSYVIYSDIKGIKDLKKQREPPEDKK